ncbi:hypothetical protein [Sphingomonas sp.]|uniref:hypothetical protein n=1 Tax=Sphingomonas sp. TaxID=28214 RepID=UPI00286DA9DD|nr:hypothetical protein [Sphingomonas sp.]
MPATILSQCRLRRETALYMGARWPVRFSRQAEPTARSVGQVRVNGTIMKKIAVTALVLGLGLAACDTKTENAVENETAIENAAEADADAATNDAANAADNALDTAGNAIENAGNAVENAGDAVENAADNAAN